MDDLHARHTGNPASHHNGFAGGHGESSGEERGDLASPLPGFNSATSPTIEQTIFDRINATINQKQPGRADSLQKYALDELGREIRLWRLQQGYTRGVLADKLQINMNQLICIENGIAQVNDISMEHLVILKALSIEYRAESLEATIQQYLSSLKG